MIFFCFTVLKALHVIEATKDVLVPFERCAIKDISRELGSRGAFPGCEALQSYSLLVNANCSECTTVTKREMQVVSCLIMI